MPRNPEAAAALIRRALAERGEDRITLSRETGLDKHVIYGMIAGQRWPRPASLAKIEKHFGWDTGTLQRVADDGAPAPVSTVSPAGTVVLDVDAGVVADLTESELNEARAAAVATFMGKAREIRAFRS